MYSLGQPVIVVYEVCLIQKEAHWYPWSERAWLLCCNLFSLCRYENVFVVVDSFYMNRYDYYDILKKLCVSLFCPRICPLEAQRGCPVYIDVHVIRLCSLFQRDHQISLVYSPEHRFGFVPPALFDVECCAESKYARHISRGARKTSPRTFWLRPGLMS